MVSNGFKSIDPVIELEANEVDIAHLRDFRIMTRSTIDRSKSSLVFKPKDFLIKWIWTAKTRGSVNQSTEGADEFSNRSRPNTHNGGDYLSVFDDNDEFAGQFAEIPKYDANGLPKGSVLHFIPSEQIKLIKGNLKCWLEKL